MNLYSSLDEQHFFQENRIRIFFRENRKYYTSKIINYNSFFRWKMKISSLLIP